MNLKQQFLATLFFTVSLTSFAQLGIGTSAPKAALDIVSSDAGLIMPRVADHTTLTVGVDQTGMQVYNTTTKSIWYYDGTAWLSLASGDTPWENDAANTLIQLKTLSNGTSARPSGTEVVITDDGKIGIGTATPTEKLEVHDSDIKIHGHTIGRGGGSIDSNIAIGQEILQDNTTGRHNTAIGNQALRKNQEGEGNTAFGNQSLTSNINGDGNTGVGFIALQNNTSPRNTSIGNQALRFNNWGVQNTAIGYQALRFNNEGGFGNTAIGYKSGEGIISTGNENIILGANSFGLDGVFSNITGQSNIVIGNDSGEGITTGSRNIILGSNVVGLDADLSNNIIIADGDGNRRINVDENGNVDIGTSSPTERLHVDGNILATGTITPDYVFEKYYEGESKLKADYHMMSLSEVERFTRANKHLPGVPSAKEVEEKGGIVINRAIEVNLEKIEELYLHIIEQQKQIEAKDQRLADILARLEALEN